MNHRLPSSFTGPEHRSAGLKRVLQLAVAVGTLTAVAGCSAGSGDPVADYPSENIEYVVPYGPGGSSDPMAREFSRLLTGDLGTSETVLNVPGGDESIGLTQLATADPDGLTLGLASSAGLLAQPMLHEDLQYDGLEDFTPIVKMADTPYALLVAADSPYKTLEDLVTAAKSKPGGVRIGTSNAMGNSAFVLYELEDQAGIQLKVIPATGGAGETALSVMGGRLEGMVATASGQLGLVESGDLRGLAYTGTDYEEYLPEATSFEDAGYDIPFTADYMTLAPAGMDPGVEEKLRDAASRVAESDEWASWSASQGNIPDGMAGEELRDSLKQQKDDISQAIDLANSRKK